MHTRDILKALSLLDPENDDHWTLDGAPRLDVLADAGLSGLTREIVSSAAPLFSRTNRDLPDLEALKAAKDRADAEVAEAERLLRERKDSAAQASKVLAAADKTIEDSHKLTRQNRAWVETQNRVQAERVARGAAIDELVKSAGGPKMLGKHPIEISEAARIRAARKNFRLKPGGTPPVPAAR